MPVPGSTADITQEFTQTRRRTEQFAAPVSAELAVIQPAVFASPTKWHLGHTSWFFEQFILQEHVDGYVPYDDSFYYLFNSYYDTIGVRQPRHERGRLSHPPLERIREYRQHVTDGVLSLLAHRGTDPSILRLVTTGIHHEQQHLELLITDLKYTLGTQPTYPRYEGAFTETWQEPEPVWVDIPEGLVKIGASESGFRFDNELPRHPEYIHPTSIRFTLVTNTEYLEFMRDNAYGDHRLWHMDAWMWIQRENINAPLYWVEKNGEWFHFTLGGLVPVEPNDAVCHVSYYEAAAFAVWAGKTLPTEAQWEAASGKIRWGGRWEWTHSAYLPYPGYRIPEGAIGEYNGKFMVNQMVLKGASVATPHGHSRPSYRNFFYPDQRWQFTGIRLCT